MRLPPVQKKGLSQTGNRNSSAAETNRKKRDGRKSRFGVSKPGTKKPGSTTNNKTISEN